MVQYINAYAGLPASAPIGHAHIVDYFNEDTNKDNLRLADGISTMLYRFNPAVLRDFLDISIPSVEIIRREKPGPRYDLIIARHSRAVTCGFIRDAEFVDLKLDFGITPQGLWVPLASFMEPFHPQGPNREELLEGFGKQFAAQIMYHSLWDERTAKEIKVDVERERP
ncbi:MAG: hypothetical protein Q9168_003811 [Polycauliona sp. 1 TL-2023]